MNGYLADTNVVSELVKPKPEPKVVAWIDRVDEEAVFLSVLTLAEIRRGILRMSAGARRTRLERWLETELPKRFAGRVLDINAEIADRWAYLTELSNAAGRPLPITDGLLAATAFKHGLVLVTRNTTDVLVTGVSVLNPWN